MERPDPRTLAAWRSFLVAHARLVALLDSELKEQRGIPLTWYDVLLHLSEVPEHRLRMHELADSVLLSRSATTRLVDNLEAAGLVGRRTCREDRRGTWVVLTDEGRRALRRAAPIHLGGVERHFGRHLEAAQAEALTEAFSKMIRALDGGAGG